MKVLRKTVCALCAAIMLICVIVPVFARAYEPFDTTNHLQRPRGFYILMKDGTKQWLSSKFSLTNNSDKNVSPVQTSSGYQEFYVDADDVAELRALVSNGLTDSSMYVGHTAAISRDGSSAGYTWVNLGTQIADQSSEPTPNGGPNKWMIRYTTFKFTPGTIYEFYYLRGIRANNGYTNVIEPGGQGYLTYGENDSYYNAHRYDEYEYIYWSKDASGVFTITGTEKFRYRVQTYSDTSAWTAEAVKIDNFLSTATPEQYKETNLAALRDKLDSYNAAVAGPVRKMLQQDANAEINAMISDMEAALENTKADKPPKADLTKYKAALSEAKLLYANTKNHIGKRVGQYGEQQVKALLSTINDAEAAVKDTSPQTTVDHYTSLLNQAIAAVKASKVTRGELRFYDPSTGITVIAPKKSLPSDTRMVVAQYGGNDSTYTNSVKKTGSSNASLYDIAFYFGNKEVQPSENITVQIPITTDFNASKTLVFFVSSDGNSVSRISSSVSGSMHIFTYSKSGNFGIYEFEETNESNGGSKENEFEETNESNGGSKEKKDYWRQDDNVTDDENSDAELKDREVTDREIDEHNLKDADKIILDDERTDISQLSKDADPDTVITAGIGTAVFGLLCGGLEFIRSKREDDFFV